MQDLRCPYCNSVITSASYKEVLHKIRIEAREIFQKTKSKLEAKIRSHYEKHFTDQKRSIAKTKRLLMVTKKQLEHQRKELKRKEKSIKQSLEAQLALKYEKQLMKQKQRLREKLYELQLMKKTLQQKNTRLQSSLRKEFTLKHKAALQRERENISRERKRLEDKEFELDEKHREIISSHRKRQESLERTIQRQSAIIDELKKEADRKSLAELGDIPEENLINLLQRTFPEDGCQRFGKGRAGGDVLQTVMYANRPIDKILYESKNDKAWKNKWITKIKEDGIANGTNYTILVTKAFPRNTKHFAVLKKVIVVSPRLLVHIVEIIRSSIVAIEKQKLSAFEKEEKVSALYGYLNSSEFETSAIAIQNSLEALNTLRGDERTAHEKMWTAEERLVNSVITKHFTKILSNIETIIQTEKIPWTLRRKNNKQHNASVLAKPTIKR